MQTMRACNQAVRMAQRRFTNIRSFQQTPELQLRQALKTNQMKLFNKKMNQFATFAKVNKAEFRRIQVAMMTVALSSTSNLILNLIEVLNSTLTSEEEEEGSSSGVRRRGR